MTNLTDIFGPVIHTYTTKQAIQDGYLIDISEKYPKLVEHSPVTLPAIFTKSLWNIITQAVNDKETGNDYRGIIWDIFLMFYFKARASENTDSLSFDVIITGLGKKDDLVMIEAKIKGLDFDNPSPALFFDYKEHSQ